MASYLALYQQAELDRYMESPQQVQTSSRWTTPEAYYQTDHSGTRRVDLTDFKI